MELAGNARQGEEIIIDAASYTGAENELAMYSHRITSPQSRLLTSPICNRSWTFLKTARRMR